MFKRFLGVIIVGSCITWPGVAVAQERAPHAGSTAVGFDVGAFIPAESELDNALIFSALLEYYLTPRISLRTDFGLTDPGFARESADSLRQIPLRLDVNYNWERGKWHPFVGAGVGAYFLRFKDNGQAFGDVGPEVAAVAAIAAAIHASLTQGAVAGSPAASAPRPTGRWKTQARLDSLRDGGRLAGGPRL